jgi:hypothetical protein
MSVGRIFRHGCDSRRQATDAIVVPQTMQILEHLRFDFDNASFPFAGPLGIDAARSLFTLRHL